MMDIKDRILYEDNHLIVVNKLSSEIVQGDKSGDETLAETVQAYIKIRDKKPGNVFLGITHRLDRPTSGIVIFAKTSKSLSRMNQLFRDHGVEKTYWAVLQKAPDKREDRWVDFLRRDRKKNQSFICDSNRKDGKKAILSYKIISSSKHYALAEIRLETGRHHQIRVQFSSRGCSISGDLKYGAKHSNPGAGIHLHARQVKFLHPVSKLPVCITAGVPRNDLLWQEVEEAVSKRDSAQ